jgi:hypothetical protein
VTVLPNVAKLKAECCESLSRDGSNPSIQDAKR